MRSTGAFSLLVSSLLMVGCYTQGQSTTHSYGSVGWGTPSEESVPGIDQAMISWFTKDGEVLYVVWTDLPGGGGSSAGSGGGSNREREHHTTTLDTSAGRQLQFEYHCNRDDPDAKGTVTIANLPFELRNGGLLIVSVDEGTDVLQSDLDSTLVQLLTAKQQTRESLRTHLQEHAQDSYELKAHFGNK